jgi:Proton-conducting membrane transporter
LITNRIGDYFFSIGLFALFWTFGNLDYSTIFSLAPVINQDIITIIGILLLLAAMGKSAQLGLHVWLPEAIEGKMGTFSIYLLKTLVVFTLFFIIAVLSDFESSIAWAAVAPIVFQQQVITGLMLSNGHIRNHNKNKRLTGNKRLELTFKATMLEFILWLKHTILGSICTLSLPTPWPKLNPIQFWFSTRSLSYFTDIIRFGTCSMQNWVSS